MKFAARARAIVTRTLSDQVFELVRDRIVAGTLPVDTPLRQDALAAELGVSKIPLREALIRLEQEGLLTNQVNRGYRIRPMSATQAEEIYQLRLSIEPVAAGFGATDADRAGRAAVEQAYDRLDRAAVDNKVELAIRNRQFHTALVRPAGRELTTRLVERLAILSERYVIAHLAPAGREDRATVEHRSLLDAWLERDADAVERLLARHIEGTLHDLRTQFAAPDAATA